MKRKEKKKAEELANYILNNMTMAEIMSVLAKRSTEIAEKIVQENLSAEDYRTIIVSEDASFEKKVEVRAEGWWTRLLKKVGLIKEPPPPVKPEPPKVVSTRKKRTRMTSK